LSGESIGLSDVLKNEASALESCASPDRDFSHGIFGKRGPVRHRRHDYRGDENVVTRDISTGLSDQRYGTPWYWRTAFPLMV
jgi:hypothetical protein